jgi:hypothetical protein
MVIPGVPGNPIIFNNGYLPNNQYNTEVSLLGPPNFVKDTSILIRYRVDGVFGRLVIIALVGYLLLLGSRSP